MKTLRLLFLFAFAIPLAAQDAGKFSVVINELGPRSAVGGDRAVELYNYGPNRALTGWKLAYYSGGTAQTVYTLPTFTLQRHSFVVVHFDIGTNTATDLYTGFTLGALGTNGELRLDDNSGGVFAAVDYVRWGTTSTGGIGASLTWTGTLTWGSTCRIVRTRDLNTRSADDWGTVCAPLNGSLGSLNAGQSGHRRHSRVMINEFQLDATPWVEVYNPNDFTVSTAGLTMTLYDGGTTPCASEPFDGAAGNFPTSLAAGQVVAIDIAGCTWYTIAAGALDGEIQIAGPAEVEGVDYVVFNNPPNRNQSTTVRWTGGDVTAANGTLARIVRRNRDLDSDNANEWSALANSDVNKGVLNSAEDGPMAYGASGGESSSVAVSDADGSLRGAQVLMTRGVFLRQVNMRLNLTAAPRDVTGAVLKESTPGSGSWASAWLGTTGTVAAVEDGSYSGKPGIPLQPGERYLIGIYVNGSFAYYREALNDPFPHGTIEGNRADINYLPGGGTISVGTLSSFAIQQQWGFEVGPDITTAALPAGEVGLAYNQTVAADPGTGAQSWSATGLPAGLTINAASGAITGTPSASGAFSVTVTVTDANGVYSRATYPLTIYPAITITTTSLPDGEQDVAYNQVLALSGGSGSTTWTLQSGTLPAGITLSTGGALAGTPSVAGVYGFTVKATDSLGAFDTQALTLTIAIPLAITTPSVLPDGAVNLAYSQTLATSGGTGAVTWVVTSGALPAGVTLSAGGLLGGTPTGSGSFTFTATATDAAGGLAVRQFWLFVEAAFGIRNNALAIGYLKYAYLETLVAGGGAPPYSFALVGGALPPGLSLSASGVISGTPTSASSYPVTIRVTDSFGTPRQSNKSFTLTVLTQPDLPQWRQRGLYGGTVSEIDFSPSYPTDGTVFARGAALEIYRHRAGDLDAAGNWTWSLIPVDPDHLYGTVSDLALSPNFDMNQVGGGEAARTVMVSLDYGVGASALYKSTDQGTTFASAVTGLPAGRPSQLAFSPNYPTDQTLWLAFYNASTSRFTMQKSTDRAVGWGMAADLTAQLGISPLSADDLAAVSAQTLFLLAEAKLYRSTDGGANWSGPLLTLTGRPRLLISPQFSIDHTLMVISGNQVWRSRNEGNSFAALSALQNFDAGAVSPRPGGNTPQWVFYDDNSAAPRVVRSLDGGDSFVSLNGFGLRAASGSIAVARPATANGAPTLIAGGQWGADLSVDGGQSWDPQDSGMHAIQFNAVCDGTYYFAATTNLGFFKSGDLGATWVFFESGSDGVPSGGFDLCAISPNHANDGILFLSKSGTLYRSTDGGQSFTTALSGQGGILAIALHPGFSGASGSNKQAVWVATNVGLYKSADAGASFTAVTNIPAACGTIGAVWTRGVAISPNFGVNDNTVFVGSNALCKSTDAGASWTALPASGGKASISLSSLYNENNATKALWIASDDGHPKYSGNGGTSFTNSAIPGSFLYLDGVVSSPLVPLDGTIFYYSSSTTSGHSGLYVSRDYGATIARVSYPPDQLATRNVTGLALGPTFNGGNGASNATVVTDGSGLFRSTDSGATFLPADGTVTATLDVKCAAVIPADATGTAVRLPPGAILYGTASTGIYRSTDGGATFRWFSNGLPAGAAVRALHVPLGAPAAPLAAIAGNGVYRYDQNTNTWSRVTGGTGTFTDFGEDPSYIYAARSDGRSQRSADAGATWALISSAEPGLVNVEDAGDAAFTATGGKFVGPRFVEGSSASLWAVDAAAGPRYSGNGGGAWTATPGGNDYALPGGQSWQVIKPLGLNSANGSRIVVSGSAAGLWRSMDGGDTWKRIDGTGSGLEATSKNFSAILTANTAYGSTDLLVGASGSTTGGVYLSGDGGEHWTQINQGFDPAQLSISTLVKTSCAGCPVNYYSGSYGGGLYTRTITVNSPPTFTGWNFGNSAGACGTAVSSGPVGGGQPFRLCGANFQTGAVVEFDGLAASGCSAVSSSVITCTGTPPHFAGPATVRVRNPDTRTGSPAVSYTFTGGDRVSNLRVAKTGGDAALTATCPALSCTASAPARVWRGQNALLTLYQEKFSAGAANGSNQVSYTDTGAVATAQSYFWSID